METRFRKFLICKKSIKDPNKLINVLTKNKSNAWMRE